MTEEEAKAQYQKCPVQTNALFNLNDELDSMLHANQLRNEMVDSKTVVKQQDSCKLVQDAAQHR